MELPFFLEPLKLVAVYQQRLVQFLNNVFWGINDRITASQQQLFGPLEQAVAAVIIITLAMQMQPMNSFHPYFSPPPTPAHITPFSIPSPPQAKISNVTSPSTSSHYPPLTRETFLISLLHQLAPQLDPLTLAFILSTANIISFLVPLNLRRWLREWWDILWPRWQDRSVTTTSQIRGEENKKDEGTKTSEVCRKSGTFDTSKKAGATGEDKRARGEGEDKEPTTKESRTIGEKENDVDDSKSTDPKAISREREKGEIVERKKGDGSLREESVLGDPSSKHQESGKSTSARSVPPEAIEKLRMERDRANRKAEAAAKSGDIKIATKYKEAEKNIREQINLMEDLRTSATDDSPPASATTSSPTAPSKTEASSTSRAVSPDTIERLRIERERAQRKAESAAKSGDTLTATKYLEMEKKIGEQLKKVESMVMSARDINPAPTSPSNSSTQPTTDTPSSEMIANLRMERERARRKAEAAIKAGDRESANKYKEKEKKMKEHLMKMESMVPASEKAFPDQPRAASGSKVREVEDEGKRNEKSVKEKSKSKEADKEDEEESVPRGKGKGRDPRERPHEGLSSTATPAFSTPSSSTEPNMKSPPTLNGTKTEEPDLTSSHSESTIDMSDPLMAGDFRPLRSVLKKSNSKPRQGKNIHGNQFLTMRGWQPHLVPFPYGFHPKPHKAKNSLWWDNVPDNADHVMVPPPVPKIPKDELEEVGKGKSSNQDKEKEKSEKEGKEEKGKHEGKTESRVKEENKKEKEEGKSKESSKSLMDDRADEESMKRELNSSSKEKEKSQLSSSSKPSSSSTERSASSSSSPSSSSSLSPAMSNPAKQLVDPRVQKATLFSQALLCILLFQMHQPLAIILLSFFFWQFLSSINENNKTDILTSNPSSSTKLSSQSSSTVQTKSDIPRAMQDELNSASLSQPSKTKESSSLTIGGENIEQVAKRYMSIKEKRKALELAVKNEQEEKDRISDELVERLERAKKAENELMTPELISFFRSKSSK